MPMTTHSNGADTPPGLTSAVNWPLCTGAPSKLWEKVATHIGCWIEQKGLIPTQVVLVLPFVQLIAPLREAWQLSQGDGLIPRIETTQTWAARQAGLHRPGAGPTGDAVIDHLQARSWLRRLEDVQVKALGSALADPLVTMANDLVQAAGALTPEQRQAYWARAREMATQPQPGIAGVEAALGPLAVAWASATESWSSDVLLELAQTSHTHAYYPKSHSQSEQAAPTSATALIVIQAGGKDTLTEALYKNWNENGRMWINLDQCNAAENAGLAGSDKGSTPDMFSLLQAQDDPLQIIASQHAPAWQEAADGEDEAERAAAEVIRLLNQGVMPVALCSQDRPIARRVRALFSRQNIPVADETGWTLSTTRSAALVMGLVRSALWDAPADTLLDAFKALPQNTAFTRGLDVLEARIRRMEVPKWPYEVPDAWPQAAKQALQRINDLIKALRGSGKRSLWAHIQALEAAMRQCGGRSHLLKDDAGIEVWQTLHCHEVAAMAHKTVHQNGQELQDTPALYLLGFVQHAQEMQMDYAEFVRWVGQALETVTFIPPAPEQPQVVMTPLARVMLRPFAAVVIPGCDETRLTSPPKLPGFWRESERVALGLASRTRWWQRLQAQWVQALRLPHVTLIWRTMDGSQPLGPATLVQRVLGGVAERPDQREPRLIEQAPTTVPAPELGQKLFVDTLSASGYQALRNCPYRFYALYMMQLREPQELEQEPDQRDYGNWLHAVLKQFHDERAGQKGLHTLQDDTELLDACARHQSSSYSLASQILWQARWPLISKTYLDWLYTYEQEGGQYKQGELAMQYAIAKDLVLEGRLDRLDYLNDNPVVIDYKTERRDKTKKRVAEPFEDVQLPFYALLAKGHIRKDHIHSQKDSQNQTYLNVAAPADTISHAEKAQAFYLSLDDREENVQKFSVQDLEEDSEALHHGILRDMARLNQGMPAFPIGQAQACAHCAAIGLCRKKYWSSDAVIELGLACAYADIDTHENPHDTEAAQ